jgi:NAD(P)-dependent dehydrogenase (short-subunit alcohol dehydrogenase family)
MGQRRSTALPLAKDGARILAADVSGAEKDTAAEMPDSIIPVHTDVTQAGDVEGLVNEATRQQGCFDIICSVVGVAFIAPKPVPDIDEADYERLMAIQSQRLWRSLGRIHGRCWRPGTIFVTRNGGTD